MATILNDPACTLSYGNTGAPNCDIKPDKVVGVILVPRNHVFTVGNVADIVTVLSGLCLGVVGQRTYPIYRFTEVKDNTEDETVVSTGYGDETITKTGRYRWEFKMIDTVGSMFWKRIQSFNNTNSFDVLFLDDSNVLWGREGSTTGTLMGFSLTSFFAKNWKINDGSKPTEYWLKLSFADPTEFNANLAFIKPATSVKDNVKGNIDLVLTEGGAEALHTLKIIVKELNSGINLYDVYPVALTQTGAWSVTKAGVAKTVSNVAASAVYKGFTLTLSDDANDDVLVVSLATPAALAGLSTPIGGPPDEGYESNTLTQTIPPA